MDADLNYDPAAQPAWLLAFGADRYRSLSTVARLCKPEVTGSIPVRSMREALGLAAPSGRAKEGGGCDGRPRRPVVAESQQIAQFRYSRRPATSMAHSWRSSARRRVRRSCGFRSFAAASDANRPRLRPGRQSRLTSACPRVSSHQAHAERVGKSAGFAIGSPHLVQGDPASRFASGVCAVTRRRQPTGTGGHGVARASCSSR
jgi:hypothetical protein